MKAKSCLIAAAVLSSSSAYAAERAPTGAVETLAQQAVAALGAVPKTVVVVAAPIASDEPAPKGDELALRIAALMAGRIAQTARAGPQTAQLGTARALAGKSGGLVYVQIEIAKGDVRATADVYTAQANAWDRIRNPTPSPIAHTFVSAKIDAEVRVFLSPILLEQAAVHKAKHEESDVLAVACGDIDGDGGNEIVLVSKERVALGRLRGGKFLAEKAAAWTALAARASSPLREPLGGAAFGPSIALDGSSALFAGTSDRGGVVLVPDLTTHAPATAIPLAALSGVACATPNPSAGAFEGLLSDCDPQRAKVPLFTPPTPRFDAFAAATIVGKGGIEHLLFAARAPDAKLYLRFGAEDDPKQQARAFDGIVGAQVAIGDLDQDGTPEIITTSGELDARADAITITSVAAGADPILRRTIPAPGGVRALCVCPPEERGAPALVAVVGDEVWIVR